MGFSRDSWVPLKQGVATPLSVNRMGRYILSAVEFGMYASRAVRGPADSASIFEIVKKFPDLSHGGLHQSYTEDGPYQFEPRHAFSDCKAGTPEDSMDGCLSDPEKTVAKLHVNWGHASARQLERVLVDPDEGTMRPITRVDAASEHCGVRRAFDKAPHAPAAGASAVAMFNEKLQVVLPFLADIIAAHVMEVSSKYLLLMPVRTKNPPEVWPASVHPNGIGRGMEEWIAGGLAPGLAPGLASRRWRAPLVFWAS